MITLKDFPTYQEVVITEPDGDMGDSPQRTFGMYHVAKEWLGEPDFTSYVRAWNILHNADSQLIRSPTQWPDPKDIPADQFDPTVICGAMYKAPSFVSVDLDPHWRRFGFYPNGNPPNLGSVSCLLRSYNIRFFWFLILLWDIFLVLGALVDVINAKIHQGQDGSWLDMDNACVRLAFSQTNQPTILSTLARKIYVWFYPQPMPKTFQTAPLPLLCSIAWKYRDGNIAFVKLWKPIIESWYK